MAVAAVCVGALMSQLDASIVTVALPSLEGAFHASVGAVTWVGLSYLVVLVGTVTAVGRFADMRGRKLLYVYGFVLFVLASVLCGLAPNLATLCGFRALQALGAAMLQANSLAIIVLVVPARSLGRAIGFQGAAQAIGMALARRVPFDYAGLGIFFPAVVLLLAAISFGADLGWSSPLIIGLLLAAVALAGWFIRHERGDRDPMMGLSLFAERRFSFGILSGVGSYLVMFGVLLLIPFYVERGLGGGVARSGLELMALPLMFGLVAPLAGKLTDHFGARPLTVSGMSVVSLGLVVLALVRPGTAGMVGLLALIGVGLGLFTSPNNAAIMGSV